MKEIECKWELHWRRTSSLEEIASPYGRWLRRQRLNILRRIIKGFPREWKVIELGCGSGAVLKVFRDMGFKNSIGVDISRSAIMKACKLYGFREGIDVYVMDAKNTCFPNRSFDVVSEEGLWEHFRNYEPLIREACRLSRRYVLALQPDHFTLMGAIVKWGWELFMRNMGGVKEYSYPLKHYITLMEHYGFQLVKTIPTLLHEEKYMVFKRRNVRENRTFKYSYSPKSLTKEPSPRNCGHDRTGFDGDGLP